MATLYISEYANLAFDNLGNTVAAPQTPALVEQNVAIGMSSAQSAAFGTSTRYIQINCDNACSVAFGANPTASASFHRMAANETRFYAVAPGSKIAVITNT